jgi:hypothetical protein
MGRKASKGARTKSPEVPIAPLYWIGPSGIEWTVDLVNFYNAESFGEYASVCFAGGRVKHG